MITRAASAPQLTFRNFNICPHCQLKGEQGHLCRMCEGVPMISRSDGKYFHLFLADQPVPYPAERRAKSTGLVSVCFWYSHAENGDQTSASVVVLPGKKAGYASFFRNVERAADLLAEKLLTTSRLSSFYQMREGTLVEAMI